MPQRPMTAATCMLAFALLVTVAACAPQTSRLRAGGAGGIQAPKLLTRVEPAYPAEAKARRIQGRVALEVVVAANGEVIKTEVKESVPLLDEAAVAAVSRWRYIPTILNGQPVEVIVPVSVNFVLN